MAIQEGELPLAPITDKQEVIELTKEEWLKYMKPLIYAIAIDDTRPILQCVCLNGNNNDTTDVVALDGYRIAKSVLPKKSNINCIIDGTTIKIITDIINKEKEKTIIKIYKTDSKLIFTIGTCSIISGIISGEYIQYQRIIPDTESMDSLEVSRVDLIHTLDRLKISQKNTPMVLLKISDSKIMLSANSEIAKMHEELPINSGIENFEIAFNINYLIDAAKQFDEEKITIYFGGSQNPCIVKNDYMLALLLPVRIGAYNA
jgi:DNA polymerase-3 subunit beta